MSRSIFQSRAPEDAFREAFSKLLKSQLGSLYVSLALEAFRSLSVRVVWLSGLPEVLARHFGTPVTDVGEPSES